MVGTAQEFARKVDEGTLGKVLNGGVELPSHVMGQLANLGRGIAGEGLDTSRVASGGGLMGGIAAMIGGAPLDNQTRAPIQPAPAPAPAAAVTADVSHDKLFTFVAQQFDGAARSTRNQSMSV